MVPPDPEYPGRVTVLAHGPTGWVEQIDLQGATDAAPALVAVGPDALCAVRGVEGGTYVARRTNNRWGDFAVAHGHDSPFGPALAQRENNPHLGICTADDGAYVTPAAEGGWGTALPLPGNSIATPALAAWRGTMYCAVRGSGANREILLTQYAGGWVPFATVPLMETSYAPALAADPNDPAGLLHLAATGLNGNVYVTSHDGSAWTMPVKLGGTTDGPRPP
ncbi:hypothetical protein [Streptomyces sp. NPDC093093]|uniref:hypothetical protein n=1 Tax=Streptomyces sp. NPDC093093 TaxID=3366025 RepID=UPI003805353C